MSDDLEDLKQRMSALTGRKSRRVRNNYEPKTSLKKVASAKKRKNSRTKGNNYELKIAKKFAVWSGEVVRRTPLSGGWSNAKFGVAGDLVCDNPKFKFHIECFDGGTLVLTADGYKPIKDIEVGDRVVSHTGALRAVTSVMSRTSQKRCLLQHGASTEDIGVTHDHPIETFDGGWVGALYATHTSHITRIQQGAHSVVRQLYTARAPKNSPLRTVLPRKVLLDEAMSYLLGLYIAEGHCAKDRVVWTFHQKETELQRLVVETVTRAFGIIPTVTSSTHTKACAVTACSTTLADTFKQWCGTGSRQKRLGWLFRLDAPRAWALIRGLFHGDGHIRKHVVSYVTVSKLLAYDLQALLMRLGVVCYVGVNKRGLYKVNVAVQSLTYFGRAANVACESPNTGAEYKRGFIHDVPSQHRLFFREPRIKRVSQASKVFNLTVETDETYIVQGNLVVHNCKRREGWSLEDLLTGIRAHDTRSIIAWWQQCVKECPPGKRPTLIFARSRQPDLLMMKKEDMLRFTRNDPFFEYLPHFLFTYELTDLYIVALDDFLLRTRPPKGLKGRRTWKAPEGHQLASAGTTCDNL